MGEVEASQVALVSCQGYDEASIAEAVGRAFGLLGGPERFANAGERILLKPNLLAGSTPEELVSPHPTVFRGVVKQLQRVGAELSYGDSPGFGSSHAVARKAGIAAVADEEGVTLADFKEGRIVSFPEGRLVKQFTVATSVLDADGLVSIAKLKTHGLTRMTGAVKNTFGCIPGLLKGEFHVRMGTVDRFSQMLVDLNALLAPRLFVMDAVVAMEGNGPRGGDPHRLGALLVSSDPVALDAVACRIIGLDTALVPPIAYGERWGLGNGSFERIELLGDPVESFVDASFVVDRSQLRTREPGMLSRLLKNQLVPKPVTDRGRCDVCGTCVKVCPVEPKAVDFVPGAPGEKAAPPVHFYDRCIRCYCCQELCPDKAIYIATPPLGRLFHR